MQFRLNKLLHTLATMLVAVAFMAAAFGPAGNQTFYLLTGTSRDKPAYINLGPASNVDRSCTSSSDSGPDSGARDNCRWNINGQWTRLELSALVGEHVVTRVRSSSAC